MLDQTVDSGFYSAPGAHTLHSMDLDTTLPRYASSTTSNNNSPLCRRRKEAGAGKRLSLASPCLPYSSSPPPSLPSQRGTPSLFSRQVPELSPSQIYCQVA